VREIDGIRVDRYRVGFVYELPTVIANVFLAEGWAEFVENGDSRAVGTADEGRILVVEDDEDMLTIMLQMLSVNGLPAVAAHNGAEALALLRQFRPALVVLDLLMPVMDGWDFRREQQRLPDAELAATPVVLLTAVPDARRHQRDLGAVDLIEKPVVELDALVERVRHWLRHAVMERALRATPLRLHIEPNT
jgi:CheY-like chemotaxis protein